jgi:hypothetical protein
MLERTGKILRIACFVLAALMLYQLVRVSLRGSLLARVTIPALPTLASDTNAPTAVGGGTNAPKPTAKGTNAPGGPAGTNAPASTSAPAAGTNLAAAAQPAATATNLAAGGPSATNPASLGVRTQAGPAEIVAPRSEDAGASTNAASKVEIPQSPKSAGTQSVVSVASASSGSNVLLAAPATNAELSATVSNINPSLIPTNSVSNALAKVRADGKGSNAASPAAMGMAGMKTNLPGMPGRGLPALPPEIKARVDRIYESEVLGQIIRVPMVLLGIAGDQAIIRSPSGQTGLVKEGDSLGEIKLLRIGINRVLVQQDERQQELMIFNGYGGRSLLTNTNEVPK